MVDQMQRVVIVSVFHLALFMIAPAAVRASNFITRASYTKGVHIEVGGHIAASRCPSHAL